MLVSPKRRSLSLSPRRPGTPEASPKLRSGSISPRRLPKKCYDGNSDVGVIRSFVRKLNLRTMDLSEIVTLHIKVIINGREFDLADFLNVCDLHNVYSLGWNPHIRHQIVKQYAQACPDTEIFVMGGSVKGSDFTTVVIAYDHKAKGSLSDPFPHNNERGAHEPEILQCTVKDGKLVKINWIAIDGHEPNRKGLIRFVKAKYRQETNF